MWHFKIKDMQSQKIERIIAKEIILFFSAIVIIAIIWGILLLRNYYYENKTTSLNENKSSIDLQLDSLEKNSKIYNTFSANLKGLYELLKKNKSDVPDTFISFETTLFEEESANLYYQYLKKIGIEVPSDYDKFCATYGIGKEKSQLIHEALIDFHVTIKAKPHLTIKEIYFKFPEFNNDSTILNTVYVYSNKLKEKVTTENLITKVKDDLLNKNDIQRVLFWSTFIILIILYPVRLCYLLLKWSIKTLK